MKRVGNDIHFEDYDWYEKVEDCPRKAEALQEKGRIEYLIKLRGTSNTTFWEWVHKRCDDYTKLDRSLQWKLKRKWDEIQDYYQSINLVNYYPNYNFKEAQGKLNGELDDCLNKDPYLKLADKHNEEFIKERCQQLGITDNLPMINSEKFEVIKYSFGPYEDYVATKAKECGQLDQTEENVAMLYSNIFRMKDEGWHVTRTK